MVSVHCTTSGQVLDSSGQIHYTTSGQAIDSSGQVHYTTSGQVLDLVVLDSFLMHPLFIHILEVQWSIANNNHVRHCRSQCHLCLYLVMEPLCQR